MTNRFLFARYALSFALVAFCAFGLGMQAHAQLLTGPSSTGANSTSIGGSNSSGANTSIGGSNSNTSNTGLQSPLKDTDLASLLNDLLNFVITIGGIAVVLMLVYVGFKFVAAQGNASALEEARTMLMWTVIGALILLGAKAIEAGIQATVQTLSS